MPMGPVQEGLAARMGGGAPAPPAPGPQAGPALGPAGPQMGPPDMGGGDIVQRFAEALGEARMLIGEMGPEEFARPGGGKDVLRGFVGSVTQLQMEMSGGAQAGGNQPMPPGPGVPPPGPPGFAGPVGP